MPGVAVNNLDSAGGVQIQQANPWYTVESEPIVVIGDLVASHGDSPHSPTPPMVEGESFYKVGGIPVSREGHKAQCGHATTGRPWYQLHVGSLLEQGGAFPSLKLRKGTYYYGGAGLNGGYIDGFINAFRQASIGNVKVGFRDRWTLSDAADDYGFGEFSFLWDAAPGVYFLRNSEVASMSMGVQDYGITGEQFNLIGYSYGSLVVAQIAIKYARHLGGIIDNLVLVGSPISQEFLNEIQSESNILNVHIIDLTQYGDPIYAGMGLGELIVAAPTLEGQRPSNSGHFWYAGDDEESQNRRVVFANSMYAAGLR